MKRTYIDLPSKASPTRIARCEGCGAVHTGLRCVCSWCSGPIYEPMHAPAPVHPAEIEYRRYIEMTLSSLRALLAAGHRPRVYCVIGN